MSSICHGFFLKRQKYISESTLFYQLLKFIWEGGISLSSGTFINSQKCSHNIGLWSQNVKTKATFLLLSQIIKTWVMYTLPKNTHFPVLWRALVKEFNPYIGMSSNNLQKKKFFYLLSQLLKRSVLDLKSKKNLVSSKKCASPLKKRKLDPPLPFKIKLYIGSPRQFWLWPPNKKVILTPALIQKNQKPN